MSDALENVDGSGKSSAIAKVCGVLKALTAESPIRLNQIAEATGIHRVTAFRILEELVAEGFLVKYGSPPRYDFGVEIAVMAAAAARSRDIAAIARGSLITLAEQTGDTIVLHVKSGAESLCVDRSIGNHPIRANLLDIGSRRPMGIGAGSMALLAWLPDEEREPILDITCTKLQRYPKFNRQVLQSFIDDARTKGYVVMCDVIIQQMGAIAMPIRDVNNRTIAAVSIAALSDRILGREHQLAALLRVEAARISQLAARI